MNSVAEITPEVKRAIWKLASRSTAMASRSSRLQLKRKRVGRSVSKALAGVSAEPGQWFTSRAEYQRGMMDAVSDPSIETVVVMSSAQVGKTEIINNVIGFHIHQDPAPILLVQPTIEMAETWTQRPSRADAPRHASAPGVGERSSKSGFGEHAPAETVSRRSDRDGRRELRSVSFVAARAVGAARRDGSLSHRLPGRKAIR